MKHFFECLSSKETKVHRIDTRVKIISVICFIFISSSLKSSAGLAAGALTLLIMLKLVGTPFSMVVRRFAWMFLFGGTLIAVFPFITPGNEITVFQIRQFEIVATQEGLAKAVLLFLRMFTAVLVLTLLNSTTSFKEILEGFKKLHMPQILVGLLEVTVRYFFVLRDELNRMKLARKARSYELNKSILHKETLRTMSQMIAVLLIRAVERSERVYFSMLTRGYHSDHKNTDSVQFKLADLLWGIGFVSLAVCIKLLEAGGYIG